MNIEFLKRLRSGLLCSDKRFLTVKEIQKIMSKGGPMPTSIFSAKRKFYIVPSRDIYEGTYRKSTRMRRRSRGASFRV